MDLNRALWAWIVSVLLFAGDGIGAKDIASHSTTTAHAPPVRYDIPPALDISTVEPTPTETLADVIAQAYRSNPSLQISRYDLRSTDEDLAQARSELRPTAQLQIDGSYDKTVPGRTTQAARPITDRLKSSIITSNTLAAQVIVDQPLYTGGKASADIASVSDAVRAGRVGLRATEGDLFLKVISAYVDIRRDARTVVIRRANLGQLEATLGEVKARREAGIQARPSGSC